MCDAKLDGLTEVTIKVKLDGTDDGELDAAPQASSQFLNIIIW